MKTIKSALKIAALASPKMLIMPCVCMARFTAIIFCDCAAISLCNLCWRRVGTVADINQVHLVYCSCDAQDHLPQTCFLLTRAKWATYCGALKPAEAITMFFLKPYPAFMLAVEAKSVIDMRLRKVARSSLADAQNEINLMVSEKIGAALKTITILMLGGTTAAVLSHYRNEVAANAMRLTGSMSDA